MNTEYLFQFQNRTNNHWKMNELIYQHSIRSWKRAHEKKMIARCGNNTIFEFLMHFNKKNKYKTNITNNRQRSTSESAKRRGEERKGRAKRITFVKISLTILHLSLNDQQHPTINLSTVFNINSLSGVRSLFNYLSIRFFFFLFLLLLFSQFFFQFRFESNISSLFVCPFKMWFMNKVLTPVLPLIEMTD